MNDTDAPYFKAIDTVKVNDLMDALGLVQFEYNKDSVFEELFQYKFKKQNKELLWSINGNDVIVNPMDKLFDLWCIHRKKEIGFYEAAPETKKITDAKFIVLEWNHPSLPRTATQQIGRQLVKFRNEAKHSQAVLGEKAGLAPARMVDIETGRTDYTIGSLMKYLQAVGRNISDLSINSEILKHKKG